MTEPYEFVEKERKSSFEDNWKVEFGNDFEVYYNGMYLGLITNPEPEGYKIGIVELPSGKKTIPDNMWEKTFKSRNEAAKALHKLWKKARMLGSKSVGTELTIDNCIMKTNDKLKKEDLKKLVQEILSVVNEVAPEGWEGTVKAMKKHKDIDNPWALAHYMKNKGMKSHKNETSNQKPSGISPDKLKHSVCPKCKNKVTILKSTDPAVWECVKCKHKWVNNCPECGGEGYTDSMDGQIRCGTCKDAIDILNMNEEHGDVHYWGAQPKDPQTKISKGYTGTVPLNETRTKKPVETRKQALRQLVIEAAKEVVNEYQHEKQHEQTEMALFNSLKSNVDRLIAMHQKGAYNEAAELELVRQIKKTVMEVESLHTGTKITTNEKTITK